MMSTTLFDFSGFYSLSVEERQKKIGVFFEETLSLETADQMVENLVGTFALPLGVASYFVIDGVPVWVPMVVEEPSVIAAASHSAKLAALRGGFRTQVGESIMMGQIQLLGASDWDRVSLLVQEHASQWIELAQTYCERLHARGGGCVGVSFRPLSPQMGVIEVKMNCLDAMGANLINTAMEGLAPHIEEITGAKTGFKILSNLCDQRLAKAWCEVPCHALASDHTHDSGLLIAERMIAGYELAKLDPYRACTHNKGVMNGVDAVVIATGNDWRAVEAGAHAYASQQPGGYAPLTHYEFDPGKNHLCASIEMPMAVGVVGGISRVHPGVQSALRLLGDFAKSARALSGLIVSVGLAQNMAAMRALAAEGIQKGHMALHERKNF